MADGGGEKQLTYTQDNVSVRILSSRGEETTSGKLEITKEKHGHVVTWTAYPPAPADKDQQRYDENSAGVWEDLSADSAVSYHVGGKDKNQSLDSVKIKKENGTSSGSGDSPASGQHSVVTFEVTDLTSYRCRQVADTHELTLNLSDGTRLPTFIFIERRYEHFIRALHEHVSFKRSDPADPYCLVLATPRQKSDDASLAAEQAVEKALSRPPSQPANNVSKTDGTAAPARPVVSKAPQAIQLFVSRAPNVIVQSQPDGQTRLVPQQAMRLLLSQGSHAPIEQPRPMRVMVQQHTVPPPSPPSPMLVGQPQVAWSPSGLVISDVRSQAPGQPGNAYPGSLPIVRRRGPHWPTEEKIQLLELLKSRRALINPRLGESLSKKDKLEGWKEVTDILNRHHPTTGGRCLAEVKKQWQNLFLKAKRERRELLNNGSKSDADLTSAQFTALSVKVFETVGDEFQLRDDDTPMDVDASRKDPLLYLVQMPAVEALHKSFDQLNLYPESSSRYDVIRKFLTNPTWDATWDGFAKVANYVTGAASGLPGDEYRLGYGYLEEQQPDSLTGLEISAHSEEPGFEVVIRTLPKRTEVKRGAPLCHEEWAMAHNPEGRIVNEASLRERIFRGGIAADLRREVWPFLLEYYSFDSTYKEREALRKKLKDCYYRMKLQWKSISDDQESRFADYRERKNLVEKDVSRTDRTHVFYQGENNSKVEMLNDILMTYVMYNFDLGYVQGMSDLLSPILMVMDNEEDAFWCFVGYIKRVMSNFDIDQSGMKKQLTQLFDILAVAVPKLAIYLEEHESGNLYFCFRWLLVLFKREFRCEEIMRLWEVLWTDLPCKNFHLLLCVAILDHEKELLIENNYGLNEILKHINDMCYRIDLELILSTAEAIVEQLKGSTKLPQSVQEALGIRIANEAVPIDASDALVVGNAGINAPASPESLRNGQRTCSTSSVEVLSDGDVAARYERHLQFSI